MKTAFQQLKPTLTGRVGQRVALSLASNSLPFLLLTVVPLYAVIVGDVRSPNLMVSDVIAAGPMYKALYIFGFSYAAYGSNTTWSDVMRHIKVHAPSLSQAVDRFLVIFHWVCQPCLLLLSAFSFDHAAPEYTVGQDQADFAWYDTIPTDPASLVNWVVHVVCASTFFVGAAACAGIYGKQILPQLEAKGLIHPRDLAWTTFAASGIVYCFIGGFLVRILHIFHNPYLWSWPLAMFEVALILFCIITNAMGTLRFLIKLDEQEPSIDFKGAFLNCN